MTSDVVNPTFMVCVAFGVLLFIFVAEEFGGLGGG